MRKAIAAALAVCLLLCACGGDPSGPAEVQRGEQPGEPGAAWSAAQIAWALWEGLDPAPAAPYGLAGEDPGFGDYLSAYYRLDPERIEDGYIRYAGGMEALEIAVLRFRESVWAEEAVEALDAYRDARAGDFTGYLPEQAAVAEKGLAASRDCWAVLLLCPGAEEALETFLTCLDPDAPPPADPDWPADAGAEEPPDGAREEDPAEPEPPGETSGQEDPDQEDPAQEQTPEPEQGSEPAGQAREPAPEPNPEPPAPPEPEPPAPNVYDGGAVRTAWASGDTAGLSEKSLAVLNAARDVIAETITDEMSLYDRELAIHDWMLAWGSYDHDTLSHAEGDQGIPDNENPYGFLILKKGICSGYSSTFQLFMDLLGIECLTVDGTAHSGTDPHAWNLVRLEGAWYAVDVTWDDPSGTAGISPAVAHKYFNVTSQFLRSHDHQWTAQVPEAEGTALAWVPPAG